MQVAVTINHSTGLTAPKRRQTRGEQLCFLYLSSLPPASFLPVVLYIGVFN